jgi:hypothetical protein
VLILLALAVAFAAPALAKEGAVAHLISRVPVHAKGGTTIRLEWRVYVPGPKGRREPFSANGMFVQLHGNQGTSTMATGRQDSRQRGTYSANVRVPRGGIREIQFGLHGSSDIYFVRQ